MPNFKWLRSSFTRAPNTKASQVSSNSMTAYWDSASLRTGTLGYDTLVRDGYVKNPAVRRAVKLISDALAGLPLTAYVDNAAFPDHPLLSILAHPNPMCAGPSFMEAVAGFLTLHGNAYIERVESRDGVPAELHILRPDRMRVVTNNNGWPVEYLYSVGAAQSHFPIDQLTGQSDILHLKLFHPTDDHYGLGGLEAAADALQAHNAAMRWNAALLENAARPSGALVFEPGNGPAALSGDQFNRLKEEMAEHFQGSRNAGRPLLLEGGLKWQALSLSPHDMDFAGSRDAAARDIAMAFGIPPMLLGVPGDATYANYAEANRAFWKLTVLPLAQRITAGLSGWMQQAWPGVSLSVDEDQISALSAERDALWARVSAADFLDSEERRAILGL
jgi:HK97 family phage portal protein